MREWTEKIISIDFDNQSELEIVHELENICEKMKVQGWSYLRCEVDGLMQSVILFFERYVE
jgi:hypothetical protein